MSIGFACLLGAAVGVALEAAPADGAGELPVGRDQQAGTGAAGHIDHRSQGAGAAGGVVGIVGVQQALKFGHARARRGWMAARCLPVRPAAGRGCSGVCGIRRFFRPAVASIWLT